MFETLLGSTALVLATTTIVAYQKTRDALHPALFLSPLFMYGAVVDPWLVRHDLDVFFPEPERVNTVLVLYFLSVTALSLGLLHNVGSARLRGRLGPRSLLGPERRQLRRIGVVLAAVALLSYLSGLINAGGFEAAFSQAKGGGYATSGYVGEAMNLGLVAVVMVALSQYRRGLDAESLAVLFLGLLPNFVQGTFGGRRGPLFLALAAASLVWLVARPKRPKVWMLGCCMAVAGLAVLFVWSQRQHMYLGSADADVRWGSFFDTLTQDDSDEGNNFIYGAAFVLTAEHSDTFTWGRALAVDLLVRPVPKQLWPTKYEDAGATWITSEYPGLGPFTPGDWLAAVGWLPLAGSAAISIADVFSEFGWGAVFVFYLIGRGFGWLYLMSRTRGGIWMLLFLETLIPSIYLATQSFSAFYYRYLILSVPTLLAWKMVAHAPRRTLQPMPAFHASQFASRTTGR
jgi:hypothetical protein